MQIQEIFYSLQGEGLHAGSPSIFIRFAGCPLRCHWCDTAYAWDYDSGLSYDIPMVMDEIKQWSVQHIVITGGEPLVGSEGKAREGLKPLLMTLKKAGYVITIETAGLIYMENLYCDLMSISPKQNELAKTREPTQNKETSMITTASVVSQFIKTYPYQLKFVIDDLDDVKEMKNFLSALGKYDQQRVMLMPQARSRDELLAKAPLVAEICRDMGLMFCQRLQILLWNGQRGR